MEVSSAKAWEAFLSEPLTSLEEFGVDIKVINLLEHRGLYVRDIQNMHLADVRRIRNMGEKEVGKIAEGLGLMWADFQQREGTVSGGCKQIPETKGGSGKAGS